MSEKIFLIINLAFFGDVLLTNGLVRNIKLNYPDSKVIYIVNKPFYEAALYQDGVDEVFCFDKNGYNKGFIGILKFVFSFPYRNNIFAAFSIYANERANILAFLLGCEKRISGERFINYFLATKLHKNIPDMTNMCLRNTDLLRSITGKNGENLPIKYNTDFPQDEFVTNVLSKYKDKDIIGLCCISKDSKKDMPIQTACEIINRLYSDDKFVFLFGMGDKTEQYANELKNMGCKFENLVNKTSIKNLAKLITSCRAVISVDTGVMHLTYAVGTALTAVFYKKENIPIWAPDTSLYKVSLISDNFSCENIVNSLYTLVC